MAVRVDRALRNNKVGRHFDVQCTDDSCPWERSAQEVVLDGIYIVRTHVPKDRLSSQQDFPTPGPVRLREMRVGPYREFGGA